MLQKGRSMDRRRRSGTRGRGHRSEIDPRVARTRATVISVGRELLDRDGPDAVTHLRIGELTGIARTTIYRHFPDPETLLAAVMADGDERPEEPDGRFDTGTLAGDLDVFLDLVRQRAGRGRDGHRLGHLLSHAERHARFAEMRDRRMDRLLLPLDGILHRARERGELDHTVDPADAAAELLGPLFFRRFFLGQRAEATQLQSTRDRFLMIHGIEPPDTEV